MVNKLKKIMVKKRKRGDKIEKTKRKKKIMAKGKIGKEVGGKQTKKNGGKKNYCSQKRNKKNG